MTFPPYPQKSHAKQDDRVGHGGDPLKLEASDASNPWMVDNVSVFLNYCCLEQRDRDQKYICTQA